MRSAQIVLLSAARFYTPLMALFALSILVLAAPGAGAGFAAGLACASAFALHLVVFGAAAARAAAPPALMRTLMTLGVAASVGAAAAPGWSLAPQAMEAGLFAVTASAGSLALSALAGRAPSLRDEDW